MPSYRVLINDNAHYMDESERADHGVVFADADEAVAACKEIVDDELNTMWKPGYDRGGLVPALRVVWAGPVCGAGQSKRS
jgi:hypothetical protein